MPLGHLNRRCHSHIVAIIPGPKEPDKLDAYLKPVLKEFKEFGPKGRRTAFRGCSAESQLREYLVVPGM